MPIRWRLTLFNALAIGAILLVLGVVLFALLRDALLSGVEETVRDRALAAAEAVENGRAPDEAEAERSALEGVFVAVRDERGRVLYRTVEPPGREEDHKAVWRRALRSGRPAAGAFEIAEEVPFYAFAVPVDPAGGSPARVVEAGRSYEDAHRTLETFRTVLAAGFLGALLLSVGGAYLLARAALSPVGSVVASASRITEGDLSERLPVANPDDEIGRLAATINGLLSRLEAAFTRREEALSHLEESLAQQRRFVADASHELRTPLTSIGGYARMLKSWGLENPETAREGMEAIEKESGRMRGLVEALLALARGDEGAPLEPEFQDLGAVAAEAVKTARAAAGGKLSIDYEPPAHRIEATFDRARIRDAAAILLDNAIRYTPEGGRVTVRVREDNDWAAVEVADTGVGIPEDELPSIFERFYRADKARAGDGAGLGLAIARQIADAHGGAIDVQSEPGKGSTFVLRLPA
ncbi:MAG: HAMP domain-containing histidine kinase [Actinomycetota bacterium]|nr:HAMP domain-containing histidine kinase [Actinomycetota bacterium]